MSVPYMGGSMRRHFTSVLIRNERGAEIWDVASDKMETSEAVSGRDFLRPLFVKATMTQDDEARFQSDAAKPMPLQVGKVVANTMATIGPVGTAFARYSVDYHTIRNYVYCIRGGRRTGIPGFAQSIVEEYNADGYVDALLRR